MATKSKKPRKSKKDDVVPVVEIVQPQIAPQPVRKRLLPHNMTNEIFLLQRRVAELEEKIESILSQLSKR